MIILSSNLRKFIAFAILVLSILLGIWFSDFFAQKPVEQIIDTREAETVFRTAIHNKKTKLDYSLSNFDDAVKLYEEVIAIEGVKKFYHITGNRNIVSVIEIPFNIDDHVMTLLRQIPGLKSERTETLEDIASATIDTQSHIEQNQYLLQRYRERLNNPNLTTREISELQTQIRSIQTKIDSLYMINHIKTEQEKQNHLILTIMRHRDISSSSDNIMMYVDLGLAIIMSFILITIVVIFMYFGIELLNRLMDALGVKSKRGSNYLYKYRHFDREGHSSNHRDHSRRKNTKPAEENKPESKRK